MHTPKATQAQIIPQFETDGSNSMVVLMTSCFYNRFISIFVITVTATVAAAMMAVTMAMILIMMILSIGNPKKVWVNVQAAVQVECLNSYQKFRVKGSK